MKTIDDVIEYCEQRAGVKLIGGVFVTTGGGLYGIEKSATATGHHDLAYTYRQQRAELQLLMYELYKKDK